ncbi:MAG: YdcH family protein [Ahrensia sp.]|nr:YdcH family protein [Ahrensia sp.]
MSEQDQAELRLAYARLKLEHADYDAAVTAMVETACNPMQIQRMKKKKLAIKDRLTRLEDELLPDIIA